MANGGDKRRRRKRKPRGPAGGGRTSFGGQTLEDFGGALRMLGFQQLSATEYREHNAGLFSDQYERLIVKGYPYQTIYGTPGRREWYVESEEWTGQIECKFQNTGGSVDEKLPYLLYSLRETDCPAMIVIHGGRYWQSGRGAAAIEWLREKAEQQRKEMHVFSVDEFWTWAHRTWGDG